MIKRFSLIFIGLFVLSACSNNNSTTNDAAKKDKKIVIGVTQIVQHPSLDAAFDGFKKALADNGYIEGKNVKYDIQIAQGDQTNNATIAQNFVAKQVNLIFANSTPSAQSALNATKDIPIVFTSVTDPVGAQLVKSFESPGGNVTGTTDTHPEAISKTINFMINEVNAKKIGVLFNTGEQNSEVQVAEIRKILKDKDVKLVEVPVATSAEVKQAVESLVGRVDALYIPTDNTVVSALESVISVANDKDIPLFVGELDSMKRGATAASGFDYHDIGYDSGLMAVDILKGKKKPSEIPVRYPQKFKLVINKKAAAEQGLKMKDEWKKIADIYEGE
jgi:putative ABC transport system substrate-binding protein